jgi:hypothetical protein
MAFTYDLTTDTGKVRLLIPDSRSTDYMFEDAEIAAFLTMESGILRAAAAALEVIASDNVMTLKVIRILDLQTDGTKVSAELRARAKALRAQADAADAGSMPAFGWAEVPVDIFSYREKEIRDAIEETD